MISEFFSRPWQGRLIDAVWPAHPEGGGGGGGGGFNSLFQLQANAGRRLIMHADTRHLPDVVHARGKTRPSICLYRGLHAPVQSHFFPLHINTLRDKPVLAGHRAT